MVLDQGNCSPCLKYLRTEHISGLRKNTSETVLQVSWYNIEKQCGLLSLQQREGVQYSFLRKRTGETFSQYYHRYVASHAEMYTLLVVKSEAPHRSSSTIAVQLLSLRLEYHRKLHSLVLGSRAEDSALGRGVVLDQGNCSRLPQVDRTRFWS